MAKLIRLTQDGPLGSEGTDVWVDDDYDEAAKPKPAPRKTTPAKSQS